MRRILILTLAALAAATFAWRGGAQPAHAVPEPGPPEIALLLPAVAGCPVGVEVLIPDPGPPELPNIALFIPPAPAGSRCAPGIAIPNPGPPDAPALVFGLPLNAATCADGTAGLNRMLAALGGELPTDGLPTDGLLRDDPCPAGTAAILAIQAIIATPNPGPPECPTGTVRSFAVRGGRATSVFLPNPGPPDCPPATALLVAQDAAGTARGWLALLQPATEAGGLPSLQVFQITPTGTPGASVLAPNPGPPE